MSLTARCACALLPVACGIAVPALAVPPEPPAVTTLSIDMAGRAARALNRKHVPADTTYPVAVLDPAVPGGRLTGMVEVKGSFTRSLKKKSLLIKLDAGQAWNGQSRIVVDSRATDGTLMRDWLAWDLWRALGMVTPDVRYLRLQVNGDDKGLYLQVGWIDPSLFDAYGLGRDGELFHPPDKQHCGNLGPVLDEERCWIKLAPRGDGGFGSLRALVQALDATPAGSFHQQVERDFDADSVVNWLVLNAVISNADTDEKNYFLYRSAKTRKWYVMPFDFDLSHGRTYDPNLPYPNNILNGGFSWWHPLETGLPNALKDKALINPVLRERIQRRLAELLGVARGPARPWHGHMTLARVEERIDAVRAAVLPVLEVDRFLDDRARFDEEVAALKHYYRARLAYLGKVIVRNDALRLRDEASVRLETPGQVADLVDEAGYLLGTLTARGAPAKVDIYTRRGLQEGLPRPEPERCVQRSWSLAASADTEVDARFDYQHETVMLSETGPVLDERRLALFRRDGERWQVLAATVNVPANTIATTGLRLTAGQATLLAACER